MRKMKEILPNDAAPKDLDGAITRLEAGEDPEKIEQQMGDLLGDVMGGPEGEGIGGGYTRDTGLYDYWRPKALSSYLLKRKNWRRAAELSCW